MSKPLFFTGRRDISRTDIRIRLLERLGESTRFEAAISLEGYRLPNDAPVVVEAYHNAYFERFIVGTVGELNLDRTYLLGGLEPGDRPHFRVKVISGDSGSPGQLLAAIDEVRPASEDDTGAAASLLPLVPKSRIEMGDEFWRVCFAAADEPHPELWINRDVRGLFSALQVQDPKVTCLIMPEILRQVLRGLVERDTSWTDEGLLGRWLGFARELHPDEFEEWDADDAEESRQRRRDWVDDVVRAFATSHQLFTRFHEQGVRAEVDDD